MTKDPQKGVRGACPSISKINQVYTVYLSCLSLLIWHKHSGLVEQDRVTGVCWVNHSKSEAKTHGLRETVILIHFSLWKSASFILGYLFPIMILKH